MRRLNWLILLLLLPFLAKAAELLRFAGEVVDAESVQIEWSVDATTGLAGFQLERSTDNVLFQSIGDRVPLQGLEYVVVDRPGLSSLNGESGRGAQVDSEQIYYYRLWYVLPSGQRVLASDSPIEVGFQMSTVSLTWGGIKAMFR